MICAGYKQNVIKEWFADYYLHNSDITFDFASDNKMVVHNNVAEPWKVTIVDTGLNTMTGGRVKRIREYVGNETFMLTYGDGVSDVNMQTLLEFHKNHGRIATMTAVKLGQRFGVLNIGENCVIDTFQEKGIHGGARINGGYMVFEPAIFNYLEDDKTVLEKKPLETLAAEGQLMAYKHNGFWQCMDTKREMDKLEEMWNTNQAPWKTWKE